MYSFLWNIHCESREIFVTEHVYTLQTASKYGIRCQRTARPELLYTGCALDPCWHTCAVCVHSGDLRRDRLHRSPSPEPGRGRNLGRRKEPHKEVDVLTLLRSSTSL